MGSGRSGHGGYRPAHLQRVRVLQRLLAWVEANFTSTATFYEVMDILDKRLNDKGKNWRHVLKSLKVLDYCLHEGSELVVTWARKNIYIIKTLREFQHIDEDGRDVGQNSMLVMLLLAPC
jgi:ENTH domain